jgi:uncharacterized integral membrane protein
MPAVVVRRSQNKGPLTWWLFPLAGVPVEGNAMPDELSVPDRGPDGETRTAPTRVSRAWIGIIAGALVLVLLLIFILQNTRDVKVSYFTLTGSMPLGVALLLAAISGLLLAGGVASMRIWQLRRRLRKSQTPGPDPVAVGADLSNA